MGVRLFIILNPSIQLSKIILFFLPPLLTERGFSCIVVSSELKQPGFLYIAIFLDKRED
jgi:hypothetical protein